MAAKRDYYEVLGIDRGSATEEIKRSFRRLAMKYHPDRNRSDGAEERFKEINEAYEVLSEPERRAAYDRYGHAGAEGSFGRPFEGFGFGGFGDIFDAFFGAGTARRRSPRRGADLRVQLDLSFEEAVFGTEKQIELTQNEVCSVCKGIRAEPGTEPVKCPTCGGSGEVRRVQRNVFGQFVNVATCDRCDGEGRIVPHPCKRCRGSGRERVQRRIEVKIPAGLDTGSQIRLTSEGEAGSHGGPRGHLYMLLNVEPHPQFRREENDIIYDLPLNIVQAALGHELEVPTLDGPVKVRVKPGTQSGESIVLKGLGIPYLRSNGRGDMLVRLHVVTPTRLTEEQKRLLRQLDGSLETPKLPNEDRGLFNKIRDALG
jgi:molecular chaperone DnaJ